MGSSPEMLFVILCPIIAGPSFVLLPLGPVRLDGCCLNLILMVELMASVIAQKLSMVFCKLLRVGVTLAFFTNCEMWELVLLLLKSLLVFLSGRVQRVVVGGIRSENVRVVSGVPQGSVLDPLLFLLYTSNLPITLENVLACYAADYFVAKVPEPGSRVQTVLSLNRAFARIGDWCKCWGMLVNPMKTKAVFRTLALFFPI